MGFYLNLPKDVFCVVLEIFAIIVLLIILCIIIIKSRPY